MEKNLGGRPRKPFDRKEAEKLLSLWCTKEEMAGWFDMSVPTFERCCYEWAQELGYEQGSFETLRNIYGANTKASLRRSQIQAAIKGNTGMLIWLGKQLLGQAEAPEANQSATFNVQYALSDLE